MYSSLPSRMLPLFPAEPLHKSGKMPAFAVVFEIQGITLPGCLNIPLPTARRQIPLLQERQADHRLGDLAVLLKIQQGNAVHRHITVMVDRQGQREAVCADRVIIPFLDPQAICLDLAPVVSFDQFRRVSGFDQPSLLVVQRSRRGDPILHLFSSLSRLLYHKTLRCPGVCVQELLPQHVVFPVVKG